MVLGIDIGGTSIKFGVFDEEFNVIKKSNIVFGANTKSKDFPRYLLGELNRLWSEIKSEFPDIKSIGCGVPGVVNDEGLIIVTPNLNGLNDYPFKYELSQFIDKPLAVDNDANTAALAELHLGSGKGLKNFVYVTLGTGIGGAIVANGKLFRGSCGGAGEIGHVIIDYKNNLYDDRAYRAGTVEVLAGREGILRYTQQILKHYPNSSLVRLEEFDVSDISEAAENNDEAAIEALRHTGELMGTALASSANLLDMSNFIIGGGISKSNILLSFMKKTIKKRCLPSLSTLIEVKPALFSSDTGIVGAAVLGKSSFA